MDQGHSHIDKQIHLNPRYTNRLSPRIYYNRWILASTMSKTSIHVREHPDPDFWPVLLLPAHKMVIYEFRISAGTFLLIVLSLEVFLVIWSLEVYCCCSFSWSFPSCSLLKFSPLFDPLKFSSLLSPMKFSLFLLSWSFYIHSLTSNWGSVPPLTPHPRFEKSGK